MLVIYYDNPNEWSDKYLKWLVKDCESKDIEYAVVNDFDDYIREWRNFPTLPMMPVKNKAILNFLNLYSHLDIDNAGGGGFYTDATAQGIYNYIKANYADRVTAISVIGRGKVGKALTDMLIAYGYTVYSFNSKSDKGAMYNICKHFSDIVVGLSTENVFNDLNSANLIAHDALLIDASNTFDTKDKLRCGKWTREVILSRV